MIDPAESLNNPDPYESELFSGYTEAEIAEIQTLMADWDRATYPTLATSIVKHRETLSAPIPNDVNRIHIRLLSEQLDEMYQVMKVERVAIARWEEDQEFSILGVIELFSTEIQGYAEQVLLGDSSTSFALHSANHLHQLNVFSIDYFTEWYFNNLGLYPQTKQYIEQLDHLRLLLVEYFSQRSSVTA